jgi:protein-S-isoprenylcysteine O-methyltransferase Ste14
MSSPRQISEHGPEVIGPPPLLYLGPLLAGLGLDRLFPLPRLPRPLRLVGLPLLAGGCALAATFLMSFRRAGTPPDPREAPKALVEDGPYAYTRNPAYLGMALIYGGITLLSGSRWPLLLLPGVLTAVNFGVIEREEAYLEERFGMRYRDYRSRVRRWL